MEYPLLKNKMPENIKKVWLKSSLVTSFVFLAIGGIGIGVAWWFKQLSGIWLMAIIIYFCLVVGIKLFDLVLIPYRYRFHRYEVTPEDLAFQNGYIFRATTYVPINRIQHIETKQGPFLRQANLMAVTIHTAATSHSVEGLTVEQAQELRQQIITMIKVAEQDV
ncbi:PH domain-containing protein [Vagococcus zengguangii]|uniref:Uncharacterized protein n=1 Tax=Vagococcus zengguangii TaxID=2571750 RepID=A0A4D7CX36_9ENTE|nr:PH domain-containing protein [Vagococcus zengguangii]QCI86957.1 hypothetical protein FA707_08250 [Vagococcus zengguangii]TLG81000.1 hypothetical protein FE258_03710 [Vagococcus zengguangii]